jgi:hypothetical protein
VQSRTGPGLDRSGDLSEKLATGPGQPAGRAVQHADHASVSDGACILQVGADRKVSEAVVVEVSGGHRNAEVVAGLGAAQHPGSVLSDELAAGPGEATRRAVQHAHAASPADVAHTLGRGADRQIISAVVVEVGLQAPGWRGLHHRRAMGNTACGWHHASREDQDDDNGDASHLYHLQLSGPSSLNRYQSKCRYRSFPRYPCRWFQGRAAGAVQIQEKKNSPVRPLNPMGIGQTVGLS